MARQAGPLYLTGTIDDITFYKMEGTYFARKKTSLDRKQFRTDPRFARSRKSAARFGEASKLASQIYHQLPKVHRGKGVVNGLTGQVSRLLKEGKTSQQIIEHFQQQYQPAATKTTIQLPAKDKNPKQPHSSAWKVTSNGKLIGPKLLPILLTDSITSYSGVAIHNGNFPPQRE